MLAALLCLLLAACTLDDTGPARTPAPAALQDEALTPLREAMTAAETARTALSADRTEGLAAAGAATAAALDRARPRLGEEAGQRAASGAEAARRMGNAPDIEAARAAFSELNAALFGIAAEDTRLQEGWFTYRCPMAKGFQKWFQAQEGLRNPYYGSAMLTCGEDTDWSGAPAVRDAPDPGAVAFWTCPMHPTVRTAAPGQCPHCGMDLVTVTRDEAATGVVRIDQGRRATWGVRTEAVELRALTREVRATARVVPDEGRLADVTTRVSGYVRDLRVDATGQRVRRGEVLFTLYSPELLQAQQELLAIRDEGLRGAARDRLRLWGMAPEQVAAVERSGVALEDVPLLAPASGWVLQKDVVTGMAVSPGMRLYRLAALDPVWVEAEVYESDLPWVKVGQAATVTVPSLPDRQLTGRVDFLYPVVDAASRTRRARVVLENPDLALLPDMLADVRVAVGGEPALVVPEEAVIVAGTRRIVFVDEGEDRLAPRELRLGRRGQEGWEVLDGLAPGDAVVVSGNFLVAAEIRIRSSGQVWAQSAPGGSHDAH